MPSPARGAHGPSPPPSAYLISHSPISSAKPVDRVRAKPLAPLADIQPNGLKASS